MLNSVFIILYRSGDIREVLTIANFTRRTISRIQQSREKYYYNRATKEKRKFANSKHRENQVPKSEIRKNLNTRELLDLPVIT